MSCHVMFITLGYYVETERAHAALSKVLRSIASTESHNLLQFLLFSYADKEEEIGRYQSSYRDCQNQCKELLEMSNVKIISPMKVGRYKCFCCLSIMCKFILFPIFLAFIQDAIQDHMSEEKKHNLHDPSTAQQLLPTPLTAKFDIKSFLPIHAKLFEKHRIYHMKQLLRAVLNREIGYHAKALEAYSQLFECLMEIEAYDEVMEVEVEAGRE